MKFTCTHCGKALNEKTMVSLELDQRINEYHDFGNVPEDQSQGWFDFGKDCAAKLRAIAQRKLEAENLI
jgi:hypothetical protein